MDYELARELKDAGFPYLQRYAGLRHKHEYKRLLHPTETIPCPTLEELIEACGNCYSFTLKFCQSCGEDKSSRWHAVLQHGDFPDHDWVEGGTPTEAVARLWLALNKK